MGGKDRDEESGKFTETYPPEEFLEALEQLGATGTTDIANFVGCDRRTAYLKLKNLEKEKKVNSQKVGNALLWRRTD